MWGQRCLAALAGTGGNEADCGEQAEPADEQAHSNTVMLATQVHSPVLPDVRPVFLSEQVSTVVKSRTAYRQRVTWMGVPILQMCGRHKHPAQSACGC